MLDKIKNSYDKYPDRNAFYIAGESYNYNDFAQIVSNIRHYLEINYKAKASLVGFLIYDDLETYCSAFGTLYAGMGFVPLNPDNPIDRNVSIIQQAGLKVILTSTDNLELQKLAEAEGFTLVNTKLLNKARINLTVPKFNEDEIAYILFTSGSTGTPKGVPLSRRNLSSFVNAFFKLGYDLKEDDRFLQMFDLTFDLSIMSYVIPLCIGACVYTIPAGGVKYAAVYSLLEEQEITFSLMVPSILTYLRPYFSEIRLDKLKYSLFCGEALYVDIINEWAKCVPNSMIQNVYGPTEATIFCSTYTIPGEISNIKNFNGSVCIGQAMDGMELAIFDENNSIVRQGEKGELCLQGEQLTPGYLNNPTKNEESFFVTTINGVQKRYYRTGDIAFEDLDGDFLYSGRKDFQIKIQGFRVELGEIEHHVRQYTKLNNVAAVAFEKSPGLVQIHLFVEDYAGEISEIKMHLKSQVPTYMIPAEISSIHSFPLNVNGKVDRKALLKIAENKKV